jgi:hypothetical protein
VTTTVTPDLKQDQPESQECPTLAPDLADMTREDHANRFDRVQGRRIGTDPYDDLTQGRKLGSDAYDDPTQGRKLGSDPYDDPTRARYGPAIAPKRSIHIQKRTT